LMQHFADPDLLRERMEVFLAERQASIDAARKERGRYERRLGTASLAIERLVDHLAEGMIDKEEARAKLDRLRGEKA
ncbi:hypothetical protein, partial [Escherichia coli]|uniref:hypothetical protein n=1 Tax=Escherichia coli TaxID=562 RepID=UPI001952D238